MHLTTEFVMYLLACRSMHSLACTFECKEQNECPCSFEDGLKLVKLRGESMQAAADAKPSAMVSVIGLSMDKVSTLQHP